MDVHADLDRRCRDWMDEPVRIPASLKDPLNLPGNDYQRQTVVMTLARELRLDERMATKPFRMTTNTLLLGLVDPLARILEMATVPVAAVAPSIVGGTVTTDDPPRLDLPAAAGAVIDFGWAHHSISDGPLSAMEALNDIAKVYRDQLERRVLKMLRRWEQAGWLEDARTR